MPAPQLAERATSHTHMVVVQGKEHTVLSVFVEGWSDQAQVVKVPLLKGAYPKLRYPKSKAFDLLWKLSSPYFQIREDKDPCDDSPTSKIAFSLGKFQDESKASWALAARIEPSWIGTTSHRLYKEEQPFLKIKFEDQPRSKRWAFKGPIQLVFPKGLKALPPELLNWNQPTTTSLYLLSNTGSNRIANQSHVRLPTAVPVTTRAWEDFPVFYSSVKKHAVQHNEPILSFSGTVTGCQTCPNIALWPWEQQSLGLKVSKLPTQTLPPPPSTKNDSDIFLTRYEFAGPVATDLEISPWKNPSSLSVHYIVNKAFAKEGRCPFDSIYRNFVRMRTRRNKQAMLSLVGNDLFEEKVQVPIPEPTREQIIESYPWPFRIWD